MPSAVGSSGKAQRTGWTTAKTHRPPGRSTRATSAWMRSASGTKAMAPKEVNARSTDASASGSARASATTAGTRRPVRRSSSADWATMPAATSVASTSAPRPASHREHWAAPAPTSSTRLPVTSPSSWASSSRRPSGHQRKSASPRKLPCSSMYSTAVSLHHRAVAREAAAPSTSQKPALLMPPSCPRPAPALHPAGLATLRPGETAVLPRARSSPLRAGGRTAVSPGEGRAGERDLRLGACHPLALGWRAVPSPSPGVLVRIGLLTGGGDCPGLNAAIRAVVKHGIGEYGHTIIGCRNGWKGVAEGDIRPLTRDDIRGVLDTGGTLLGTARFHPHRVDGGLEAVRATLENERIDALICIGGDGTLHAASKVAETGVNVVAIPKTIDNDVAGTDRSIGFDTAVHIATEAIDRIHTTAESHNRVMVIELMGREAGWIAVQAGIAGGAEVVLTPEEPFDIDAITRQLGRASC